MTPWTEAHQAPLSFTVSKSAQTHVHWVSDAVYPSHPLLLPSPFAFSLSQHQGVFQWVGTAASATVLPMNVQGWFPLGLTGPISLLSKGLSRVFSNFTIWKHQQGSAFCMVQFSHPYITTGKIMALTIWTFVIKIMELLGPLGGGQEVFHLETVSCLKAGCELGLNLVNHG